MPFITLANQKKFASTNEATILRDAQKSGITLEYSCSTGRCGVCKAKALSGETKIIQPETALSPEEISAGYILTCCRGASSDVSLDVEDLGRLASIEPRTLPCRINTIESLAPDVVKVTLRLPPTCKFNYLPGQYINVIWQGVHRSYSIANAPQYDNNLTLHIRREPEGLFSAYWFGSAKPNDLLRLEGPLGTFCLRPSSSTHLIFLATGTGIAPVKAMLEELSSDSPFSNVEQVFVYWGGRTAADIYWRVAEHHPNVRFIPSLSGPTDRWSGRRGYVQEVLLEDGLNLSNATVYACGSDAMIHSAQQRLTEAGLSLKSFYSDAFVCSN